MSAVARRLLAAFVEPLPASHVIGPTPHRGGLGVSSHAAVALVGHPSAVAPAAAATALLLGGRGAALLATVGPPAPTLRAPATPGAARAAARLRDRGHDAAASGRLVRLTGDPVEVMRATAAGGRPVVVALGTPRGESVDRLLAAQDAVLVAAGGDGSGLVPLVLAGLAPLGIPRAVAPAAPDGASAALATAGIAVGRRWAAGLRAAMESAT